MRGVRRETTEPKVHRPNRAKKKPANRMLLLSAPSVPSPALPPTAPLITPPRYHLPHPLRVGGGRTHAGGHTPWRIASMRRSFMINYNGRVVG